MKSNAWNFSKNKTINAKNRVQTGLDDFPKYDISIDLVTVAENEKKYKVYCNSCGFIQFTDDLLRAKQKAILHDNKNETHTTFIAFQEGVEIF